MDSPVKEEIRACGEELSESSPWKSVSAEVQKIDVKAILEVSDGSSDEPGIKTKIADVPKVGQKRLSIELDKGSRVVRTLMRPRWRVSTPSSQPRSSD